MKKNLKIIICLLLGTVLLFVCYVLIGSSITIGILNKNMIEDIQTWHDQTIPLTQEVIDDICENLEIPSTDPRCNQSTGDVYGPDFYDDLYMVFTPENRPWATEEIVNEKLGKYLFECEPYVNRENEKDYRRCFYDFAGDKRYHFVFYFFEDGEIKKLIAKRVD